MGKRLVIELPEGAEVVHVEIRLSGEGEGEKTPPENPDRPQDVPVPWPCYVMTARPTEWEANPEWARAGAVGVHLRLLLSDVYPQMVVDHLDTAQRLGIQVGLAIAVHNSRDWGRGTVFTRHVRVLSDGTRIPDYWSESFINEYVSVHRQIAEAVKDHPALAWIGHTFGLDDEAWPVKPWDRAHKEGLDIWGYMMNYVRTVHELAKLFDPVPVLAQCYPMYSRQGLDVLFKDAPVNMGLKLNGWKTKVKPRDRELKPYWDRAKDEGRMVMLEPGIVPSAKRETNRELWEALREVGERFWQPDAVNVQRQFLESLVE